MRPRASILAVAVVATLSSWVIGILVSKSASAAPTGGVAVLSQTQWVESHGSFDLRLGVPAGSGYRVQVTVFDRLITRTAFDQAAKGKVGAYFYRQVVPVSTLLADPSGGVDLSVPVNAAPPGSTLPTLYLGQTGVFPVQVELFDAGANPLGSPQSIFLEYASGPGSGSAGYLPLSVALVVPFSAGGSLGGGAADAPPSTSEASRLNQLSVILDRGRSVPVGLLADPRTLSGLAAGAAAGSTIDASTLSNLSAAAKSGSLSVMPSTFDPSAITDFEAVGLGSELAIQSATGTQVIHSTLGVVPSEETWVFQGSLDPSALSALLAQDTRNVIVPDSSLSALPAVDTETTFAKPASLSVGGQSLTAMGADPALAADFESTSSPAIAANRIVAELAMIETESPGLQRGVALVPPAGWSTSPKLLASLIAGIAGNPLIDAVSATGLFASVPVAPLTRTLAGANPLGGVTVRALGASATSILATRRSLRGVTTLLLGGSSAKLKALATQLLLSESASLAPSSRAEILRSINQELGKIAASFALPPATAITLTASHGHIPITILVSGSIRARVQVRLTSQRLLFPIFRPADGSCSVPTPTEEICIFSLSKQNTTLDVPVEARSSGVFPLQVELYTPDGSLLLASDRDTVRSTAVSGVAIILAILAALSLAVWWGRDLRRGRRRRGLVPSPFDEVAQGAQSVEPTEVANFDLVEILDLPSSLAEHPRGDLGH